MLYSYYSHFILNKHIEYDDHHNKIIKRNMHYHVFCMACFMLKSTETKRQKVNLATFSRDNSLFK